MPTLKKVSKSRFFYQFGMETVPEASRTDPTLIFKKAHPVGVLEDWSTRPRSLRPLRHCPRQPPQARGLVSGPGFRFAALLKQKAAHLWAARHGETLGQRRYITGMHLGADVMLIVTRVTPLPTRVFAPFLRLV